MNAHICDFFPGIMYFGHNTRSDTSLKNLTDKYNYQATKNSAVPYSKRWMRD